MEKTLWDLVNEVNSETFIKFMRLTNAKARKYDLSEDKQTKLMHYAATFILGSVHLNLAKESGDPKATINFLFGETQTLLQDLYNKKDTLDREKISY